MRPNEHAGAIAAADGRNGVRPVGEGPSIGGRLAPATRDAWAAPTIIAVRSACLTAQRMHDGTMPEGAMRA
jgi:hypothetical protein